VAFPVVMEKNMFVTLLAVWKAVTWHGNSFKTAGMSFTIDTREDSCCLDSSRLNDIIVLSYHSVG